jgi:hypothetical protein
MEIDQQFVQNIKAFSGMLSQSQLVLVNSHQVAEPQSSKIRVSDNFN